MPAIALDKTTRVFQSWCDPAPGCISGVTMNGYTNAHGAVILAGACTLRYTDPDDLRELAANIERMAQRMEMERSTL